MVALASEELGQFYGGAVEVGISGAAITGWKNLGELERLTGIINIGAMQPAGQLLVLPLEALDGAGAGSQIIPGYPVTITQADQNKQLRWPITQDDLSEGFTHVQMIISSSNGPNFWQFAGFVDNVPNEPASDFNNSTVADIVQ